MCEEFLAKGVLISKVYYSPFHPIHGLGVYKKDDESRKPKAGMIYQAVNEFCIDLKESVLIGDKPSDIQAGINAGVGTNIYIGDSQVCKDLGLTCHYVNSLHQAESFL
jgi:D-glycero-D-manno-heptose 1,7-bisphosphate phosphatase